MQVGEFLGGEGAALYLDCGGISLNLYIRGNCTKIHTHTNVGEMVESK